MTKIGKIAMTHGGKFHADDVFSSALLKIMRPGVRIIREFRLPETFKGLVFDMGGGRFDHHQEGSECRENGVPYAAFGLLWREFGESLVGAEEAVRFDEHFIQPLDEHDNTGCGNSLARVIGKFNPDWDSDESPNNCFAQAVAFAELILNKELNSIHSVQRARGLVENALAQANNGIVILPRYAPWKDVLIESDAVFVVYPSQRGGFSAQVIPDAVDSSTSKCDFPDQWAGKSEAELQRVSGIETLSFCHNSCFLITAGTLDDVVRACLAAQSGKA